MKNIQTINLLVPIFLIVGQFLIPEISFGQDNQKISTQLNDYGLTTTTLLTEPTIAEDHSDHEHEHTHFSNPTPSSLIRIGDKISLTYDFQQAHSFDLTSGVISYNGVPIMFSAYKSISADSNGTEEIAITDEVFLGTKETLIADFDQDGDLDIVFESTNGGFFITENELPSSFDNSTNLLSDKNHSLAEWEDTIEFSLRENGLTGVETLQIGNFSVSSDGLHLGKSEFQDLDLSSIEDIGEPTNPPGPSPEWDFWVNRTLDGITFGWEDSPNSGYSLNLYNGEDMIYYGGHPAEYAEVNFSEFGLNGNEPLRGEFWEYGLNGEFIRATPKFVLFPDFNNQIFRVFIDQKWSETNNQGTLEGFTIRWDEDRTGSVLGMDLFHPGGGPFPGPNGDPGDDRMFFKKGTRIGEIHGNWSEVFIDVSLSDYNLTGNELLEGVFWEFDEEDESEIANSGSFFISLSEWTGIPSSAYVPETLEGVKLRISEVSNAQPFELDDDRPTLDPSTDYTVPILYPVPVYTERIVTLGKYDPSTQSGSAMVDDIAAYYTYSKSDNIGKLKLSWIMGGNDHEEENDSQDDSNNTRRLDMVTESSELEYKMYFDADDFGYGSGTFNSIYESNNFDLEFEIIEYGFPVHTFTNSEVMELIGLSVDLPISDDISPLDLGGTFALHYSGGPNGEPQGYLEPVYEVLGSGVFYETLEPEDSLGVDLINYPGYAAEDFVAKLPIVGYKFYQSSFSLPRKAREYLEIHYRNEDGSPTSYWEEEREIMDMMMGTTFVELVAYMESGIEVIFNPDGSFKREYDPWGHIIQEFDAKLSFNPLASSWGTDGKFTLDGQTTGASPAHVCVRKADDNGSEHGSILYQVSLLNDRVGEDMDPILSQFDLANTDLPAGTSVSLTFNYEEYDPKYLIVSGAEVIRYRNKLPSWDGSPGSFTIQAKTVKPVASSSNENDSIGSTFGISIQMGGERYYGGAIFETNVIPLDVGPAVNTSPMDRVFSFSLNGKVGVSTAVRALMPKSQFNTQLGIYEMSEVKAAIADENGVISFIAGSRSTAPAESGADVGSAFQRIPHEGNEPAYQDPLGNFGSMMPVANDPSMDHYLLNDLDFGIEEVGNAFVGNFDQSIAYDPGSILIDGNTTYIALEGIEAGTALSNSQFWQPIDENDLLADEFSIDNYVDPVTLLDYGVNYSDPTIPLSVVPNTHVDSHLAVNSDDDPLKGISQRNGLDHDYLMSASPHDLLSSGQISYEDFEILLDFEASVNAPAEIHITDANRRGHNAVASENLGGKISQFDFNGDEYADSLLEISFVADIFPGEVQIGDPFDDPLAGVNPDELPVISGVVSNSSGKPISEFGIYVFSAPDGIQGFWEPAIVYEYTYPGNGVFEISVMPGEYYVEAWGHDPSTAKMYKAQIYGDNGTPALLSVVDGNSSKSNINFFLEEEYSPAFIHGNISSKLEGLNLALGNLYAGLELTPVKLDQNKTKLTDYPLFTLNVNFDGSITGDVPIGDYLVELSSYGSPMDLDTTVYWSIKEGENIFDPLVVNVKKEFRVTGRVVDQAGDVVWADVVFVNPLDKDDIHWPSWNPMTEVLSETPSIEPVETLAGSYSVSIPEGNYKIMAQDYSGLYKNGYYGGTNFENAPVVTVDENKDLINITMQSGSVSTLTLRLENNESEPISGAWINVYDAFDEYSMFYPQTREANEGNYSLIIPEGAYKIQVSAPSYKSFFMVRDATGNIGWKDSYWQVASTVTAKEGNATDLGVAVLEKNEIEDWMLYDMLWLETDETDEAEEDKFVGNILEGIVQTDKGENVPSARIIVRTADYLIEVNHVLSKSDGTFKVENLPDGDWIVYAEPSEEFQDYRSSNENRDPITLQGGELKKDVSLLLQGANVSGRVMYPENGKATALADAHVWVFEDMDGDKVPDFNDWFVEEDDNFEEDFVFTDDRGFFSFNLQQGVSYSMKLDLPGRLAALSPDPISFTVTDEKIKIGNAIRLDWKAAGSTADMFDIQKRLKGRDTWESLFDSEEEKLTAGSTSYVDNSVLPGKSYEYRVFETENNKTEPLKDEYLRVSPPVFYLTPPSKTVKGGVLNADTNKTISGAMIEAWRTEGEGWATTTSSNDGSYELTLGSGEWEISVYRPYGKPVSWVYDGTPTRVFFKEDSSVESISIDRFIVSEMGNGKVTGSVKIPEGITAAQISQYVYVDVYDPMGRGDWANPDAEGKFQVPLQPGEYELTIWVDPVLEGYGSPDGRSLRVGKKNVPVGELELVKLDSKITGTLTTSSGNPLIGVEVWAWSEEGGWASDFTNTKGAYTLDVAPGRWEVGYEIPMATDGSEPPYLSMPPKKVRIKGNNQTKELDLKVRDASASVSGVVLVKQDVLDSNGTKTGTKDVPVVDLDAWVYAIKLSDDSALEDGFQEVVAEVPLSQFGTFSFPSFPGSYSLGIWLPPGSDYAEPAEKVYRIEMDGTKPQLFEANSDKPTDKATFILTPVTSTLTGVFKDGSEPLKGLIGEVHAMRTDADGWQFTPIEENNGTYSMTLPAGDWIIDYYIEDDKFGRSYPNHSQDLQRKTIVDGFNSLDFDFSTVEKISSSISGIVRDENGKDLNGSSVYVWVFREETDQLSEYWNEVETGVEGNFTIPILPGGSYEVGIYLTEELRIAGYMDSPIQDFRLKMDDNLTDVEFKLVKPSTENFISGLATDSTGRPLVEAFIYAMTYDGLEAEAPTDQNGAFKILVPGGNIWQLGAEYSEINESGEETFYFTEYNIDIDLRSSEIVENVDLVLKQPDFIIPDGTSVSFDPSSDFVTLLPDGTELMIPGGAANVSEGIKSVRLVVTPNVKGLSRDASVKTANYGYSIELFDNKGKKVEGQFKKDVVITIPVDLQSAKDNDLDLSNIEGKYYSSTKGTWESAKTSTWDKNNSKLTLTTDHFSDYVVASNSDNSELVEKGNSTQINKTSSGSVVKDWYHSDWLGSFYDAGNNWIYHFQLGWLYTKKESTENFWFFDSDLGWLWTGPSYFDLSSDSKSFLYSQSLGGWLHFKLDGSTRKFYQYSTDKWILSDKTETSAP